MNLPYPLWANADEIEYRFWEADSERHDAVGWDEPEAQWPEVVDDRCRICGQVVDEGLVECSDCFVVEDVVAKRREDW